MIMRRGRGLGARATLALVLAASSSCAQRGTPELEHGTLPPGVAAVVGDERVATATVARIAQAAAISLQEARRRAIDDALYASFVRADPESRARVNVAERGALAREVLEGLRDRAHALGPPTDDEVSALTAERWPELDRPASVRTTHAIVLVRKPSEDAPAHALAAALATALAATHGTDEFLERARAFPHSGLEIRAERLPPVTTDGRLWDPDEASPQPLDGSLDADFTRAANTLGAPGDQSGVVKSAFGYHVIRLEQRYPELRIPFERRRELLADEIYMRRAKRELDALSERLRAATPVRTDRAVEALTALVPVGP
jgi:hypothetical protein